MNAITAAATRSMREPVTQKVQRALDYVESLGLGQPGRYRYARSKSSPLLYASAYAAMTKGLCGSLADVSEAHKEAWIAYLNSFQSEDGLYRDPLVANEIAEVEDWWGWRHATTHVITALTYLGGVPRHAFSFLQFLYAPGAASSWVAELPWDEKPDFASNTLMNYGVLLQYERDFHDCEDAGSALNEINGFLDETQDPETGLWGTPPFDTPEKLSVGIQTAYHLWILYFYDGRPITHLEKAVESCLATQNRVGGYGVTLSSSACEDIDSIDPLCRLSLLTDHRREDVRLSLRRAMPWVWLNQMDDGGFVFQRDSPLAYGHDEMTTAAGESNLFASWFRLLSLAYMTEIVDPERSQMPGATWVHCPGYQYWRGADS